MIKRAHSWCCVVIAVWAASGCSRQAEGPILAGGREVKSWLADLHDPKPQVRRQAVLKLGNVGDSDAAVPAALAEVLRDPDPLVRRDAVLAVAKLSKPSEAIVAELKAMSQSDRDPLVRDYAARSVAQFDKRH